MAERLGQRVDLAAEAAADRAADEMKGVGWHIEDLGAGVEREEQRLRRGVDDIAPVGVGRGDRAVGLGRRMLDRRHLVALLEHMVGAGEAALDVAEAQLLMIIDVVIGEGVLRIGLVDDRRARLHRLLDVEDRRQRLIVDADLRHRLERLALAVGDDRDDRLALVAHLVDRERRLVVLAEIDQAEQGVEIARNVGAANDPAHAGQRSASPVSMRRMRAWACGLRNTFRCSMPCSLWSLK